MMFLPRVQSQAGSNWSQWLLKRSRRMTSQKFSNNCLPACAISWQTLSKLGTSLKFRLNSKRMLPYFPSEAMTPSRFNYKKTLPIISQIEVDWKIKRAKRRLCWSSTSSRTSSEADSGHPQIELRAGRIEKRRTPTGRVNNALQPMMTMMN